MAYSDVKIIHTIVCFEANMMSWKKHILDFFGWSKIHFASDPALNPVIPHKSTVEIDPNERDVNGIVIPKN